MITRYIFGNETVLLLIAAIIVIAIIIAFFCGLWNIAKGAKQLLHPKNYEDMDDEERLEYLQRKESPAIVSFSQDSDAKQHFFVFNTQRKIVALGRVYDFTQYKGMKTEEWTKKTGKLVDVPRDSVFYVDPVKGVARGKMEKVEIHQKIILSFDDDVRPTVTYEFTDNQDLYQGILEILPPKKM